MKREPEHGAASTLAEERIDPLCNEFETRFTRPPIEEYLKRCLEIDRPLLLRELLRLELEFHPSWEALDAEGYRRRFPEYPDIVNEVLHERSCEATAAPENSNNSATGARPTSGDVRF